MAEAIEELNAAVREIANYILQLPAAEKRNQAWGQETFGPKEVLAHLVFYHELYVEQMQALEKGAAFEPPQGTYDELNRKAVEASLVTETDALAQRLLASQARMNVLYQALDPDEDQVQAKREAKKRTLRKMVEQEARHIRRHLRELRSRDPG